MFNLFKKSASAEVYGHQMWLLCCEFAERFCNDYGPQLKAAGFLRKPKEDVVFQDEAMRLHLWLISRALGMQDRNVLDALHNHAHDLTIVDDIHITNLYALYDQAAAIDNERQANGIHTFLSETVFQRLINTKKPNPDPIIEAQIQISINIIVKVVRDMRSEFKIKG